MSAREVIDELDRCKTALQVVAEMQSDGLAILLDLLLDRLDDAIGQVQARSLRGLTPQPLSYVSVPEACLTGK